VTSLFISYSRKDTDCARRLTEAFKGQKIDLWIDWEDIPPTVDWWCEVERGIEQAGVFLFLVSPDSIQSRVCRQEIDHALKNGKRLIPVVVREVNAEKVPTVLSHLNWIFFRESDDFNTVFNKLITAIKTDYDWVRVHRELQIKALEWDRSKQDKSFLLRGTELHLAEFQLKTNASKEPKPTDLQKEYIAKSRRSADKQRNTAMGIGVAIGIVLTGLTIFGLIMAGQKKEAKTEANYQASLVRTAEATAISSGSTATSAKATALANEEEAKRQAKIAFSRQLAAQAQQIYATGDARQELAVLLATLSMQNSPIIDSAEILQNNVLAYPIAELKHQGFVESVAFSPDGKKIVSGSQDNTARVWESATGKEIAKIIHDGSVRTVAYSPDGRYVVSGSEDNTVRVWEAATGNEIARMTHEDYVDSVAFSPDNKYVVSGSLDKTARVWDFSTGKEIARVTHDGYVSSIDISPDGRYVVSGSEDGTARVWETNTGIEIARVKHNYGVTSVAFSQDGKFIVSGSSDGHVIVWDSLTSNEIARMNQDAPIFSIAISPDDRYVVFGGDISACVWDSPTGEKIACITLDDHVFSNAFSPDSRFVVSGSADGTARLWEALTGKEISRMTHLGEVWSVAFSPDGRYVVSASTDNTARVWEAATNREKMGVGYQAVATSVAFSPDRKYKAVVNNENGTACVWEVNPEKKVACVTHDYAPSSIAMVGNGAIAFSPNGKYVISSGDYTARVWDPLTGNEIARMTHTDYVDSVAFSPDNRYAASGDRDGNVRVWDVNSGKEVTRAHHDSEVNLVTFSLDGRYVISGDREGIIHTWAYLPADLIADACSRVTLNLTRMEWKLYVGDATPYKAVCANLPIEPESALTTPTP
jgi:WD40 repeat protein